APGAPRLRDAEPRPGRWPAREPDALGVRRARARCPVRARRPSGARHARAPRPCRAPRGAPRPGAAGARRPRRDARPARRRPSRRPVEKEVRMKLVLFVVVGIVALVALMTVVGALLPRQHVAARSARIRATADALWQTLTDFA